MTFEIRQFGHNCKGIKCLLQQYEGTKWTVGCRIATYVPCMLTQVLPLVVNLLTDQFVPALVYPLALLSASLPPGGCPVPCSAAAALSLRCSLVYQKLMPRNYRSL